MLNFLSQLIPILFYFLLSFTPLILWPNTYEVFEFNKMITVYIITVLIMTVWLIRMILAKKIILRRTIFDIPLLIFLGTQLLSTFVSVDMRTSLLGYYSRFNGGFVSSLCYSLLYWAFVTNMDKAKVIKALKFLLFSAFVVSLYGIAEHFGIDKNIWVQDVQNRVFSTLGQPNWLAAWLVAILPISWAFILKEKIKSFSFWLYTAFSFVFFITLLFTKSRSGILGLGGSLIVFWGISLILTIKKKIEKGNFLTAIIVTAGIFILTTAFVGTPWTPKITDLIKKETPQPTPVVTGPALETGGTESGVIRQIVWKGAIEICKHYPILGTGVETFAFSYYNFRPAEHNLTSEWDFLYNKAHNEYLNILATTGTVGFLSYFSLIVVFIVLIVKSLSSKNGSDFLLHTSFLAGFISILLTNFFGFSVVVIALLFFLFPAFSSSLNQTFETEIETKKDKKKLNEQINSGQKILAILSLILGVFLLIKIGRYWTADINFNKGKVLSGGNNYLAARTALVKAVSLSPREAIFWSELAENDADIAVALNETGKKDNLNDLINTLINEANNAQSLSPNNLSVLRQRTSTFIKLSAIDPNYINKAREALEIAVRLAPTDAKLIYNLGLIYAKLGAADLTVNTLKRAIDLKSNYKEARLALAVVETKLGNKDEAKAQYEYVLKYLAPGDTSIEKSLQDL
jgi:O-antigen ligase/Flp pilus assembly protein TadD